MGAALSKAIAGGLVTGARMSRPKLGLFALVAVALSLRSMRHTMKGRSLGGGRKKGKSAAGAVADTSKGSRGRTKQIKVRESIFTLVKRVLKDGMGTREYTIAGLLSCSLLSRTYLSLWIAANMGDSIGYFTQQQWTKVAMSIFQFGRNTIAAALVNASLKYFTGLLAVCIRERLTKRAHVLYMQRMNYYKANHVGDDKLENADQLICEDVEKFSSAFADVYSQSLKPIVDFVLFSVKMGQYMGVEGPLGMYTWFVVAVAISAKVAPRYGKLAATEQTLEGRFRSRHAKLIQNAEMVAFMRGERPEVGLLDLSFRRIKRHVRSVLDRKFWADGVQGYVNKYAASVVGFGLTARPVLLNYGKMGSYGPGQIAKYYVESRQIMESLANAVLALFELQKRVGTLSGLSARVDALFQGLRERSPVLADEVARNTNAGRGPKVVADADVFKFHDVDVHKPDGVLLLKKLNIEVQPGTRVMITGDNGCGKSSLFRVMCGLWPQASGTIHRPRQDDIYFLSQVNFVPVGTLREIIIYPKTVEQFREGGGTDASLREILEWSHLGGFKCDGVHPSLDDVFEWETALSPGQKQRMAFARLFYARPRFAVLDECTNGVAPSIESDLYQRLASLGMAVFSISHKNELKKHHDFELHFHANEEGGWDWIEL